MTQKVRKTVSLEPEQADWVDEQDDLNLSAVVRDVIDDRMAADRDRVDRLRDRRDDLRRSLDDVESTADDLRAELETVETELEQVQTREREQVDDVVNLLDDERLIRASDSERASGHPVVAAISRETDLASSEVVELVEYAEIHHYDPHSDLNFKDYEVESLELTEDERARARSWLRDHFGLSE